MYNSAFICGTLHSCIVSRCVCMHVADRSISVVSQGYLEQFGPLLDMRVFRKNCYGFAQYTQHSDAVMAILGGLHATSKPANPTADDHHVLWTVRC